MNEDGKTFQLDSIDEDAVRRIAKEQGRSIPEVLSMAIRELAERDKREVRKLFKDRDRFETFLNEHLAAQQEVYKALKNR